MLLWLSELKNNEDVVKKSPKEGRERDRCWAGERTAVLHCQVTGKREGRVEGRIPILRGPDGGNRISGLSF